MSLAVVLLAYDPNDVKPGWIALFIVAGLGLATFLLWRSMNTQLGRIQVPPKNADRGQDGAAEPDGQEGAEDSPDSEDEARHDERPPTT